jgi:hypothetical protein
MKIVLAARDEVGMRGFAPSDRADRWGDGASAWERDFRVPYCRDCSRQHRDRSPSGFVVCPIGSAD